MLLSGEIKKEQKYEETYKNIYKFIKYKNWDQLLFLLKGIIDPVKEK